MKDIPRYSIDVASPSPSRHFRTHSDFRFPNTSPAQTQSHSQAAARSTPAQPIAVLIIRDFDAAGNRIVAAAVVVVEFAKEEVVIATVLEEQQQGPEMRC